MLKIQTKLTSQGQVSIPAAVRHLLGLTPGSTVEWLQDGGDIIVKRAVRSSSADVHTALFPEAAQAPASAGAAKTLDELKQGIAQRMQRKYRKANAGD
jgi:AbrB family looped-hinge helix DNA binding protein